MPINMTYYAIKVNEYNVHNVYIVHINLKESNVKGWALFHGEEVVNCRLTSLASPWIGFHQACISDSEPFISVVCSQYKWLPPLKIIF